MSTRALIGRRPIALRRRCIQAGLAPLRTPRTRRSAKAGQSDGPSPKSSRTGDGIGKVAGDRARPAAVLTRPRPAAARSRAMPATPVQSGRFGVRLISMTASSMPGIGRVGRTDGGIGRQVDDAVMIVRQLELRLGDEHAAALDAANGADAEGDLLAGDEGAGRREDGHHAGAGIRRAADDLHRRAGAGIDQADAQLVGVGVRLGRDDAGDREGRERLGRVGDMLDLEADARQRVGDSSRGASVSRCSLSQDSVNFIGSRVLAARGPADSASGGEMQRERGAKGAIAKAQGHWAGPSSASSARRSLRATRRSPASFAFPQTASPRRSAPRRAGSAARGAA